MNNLFFAKIKKIIVTIISGFIPSKNAAKHFRKICFLPEICLSHDEDLPLEKYGRKINVSFCFDSNLVRQAAVSIASLLGSARGRCDYDIYCVIGDDVTEEHRDLLTRIKNEHDGGESNLIFLHPNHDFDESNRRDWSIAIWYRMMLPKLLPDKDRIIYADIDVVFCSDLVEADRIDFGDNLIAAVTQENDNAFNSGFLIMNLDLIRREKMYEKWIEVSQTENFSYPDQHVLNKTCAGRCLSLPLKYNFQPGKCYRMAGKRRFSDKSWHDLKYHIVMMHYAGPKPWNKEKYSGVVPDPWWHYAKQTGLW
jgi:lipopolysaccharide biosynthesis glycosyltransferase